MAAIGQLLLAEEDGTISFGNYELDKKGKLEDFEFNGDVYKVKTFQTMTKLEKNGLLTYESVPGTNVHHFLERENGVDFFVEGAEDAQLTIGLQDETEYEVYVDQKSIGKVKTNMGGKLNLGIELVSGQMVEVKIER